MSYKGIFGTILFVFISIGALISAPDIEVGKSSFKNNCASCHNKNMKDPLTGPALGGSVERWAAFPRADLHNWVRNSQALIKAGHPRATELWNQFKPTVMTAFPNLSDEEIESIFLYVDGVYKGTYGPKPVAAVGGTQAPQNQQSGLSFWIYLIFALLIGLALFLWNLMTDLAYQMKIKAGDTTAKKQSVWQLMTSKSVISFVIFALVLFGGYTTVNNAISLGRQQNYQPDQPIKFSHETHAGLNKIDCNYCHDGARRSKQSLIPATNTCMNCHAAIKKGSQFGTAEISKIYASIGYNPNTDKYIDQYEKLTEDEIAAIYKKWIATTYAKDNNLREGAESAIRESETQWEGIKSSLTSDTKSTIPGPIEWKRIHNLPDHVYFNHSQHVTIGKLACQTCHGKIENMPVVKQYAPLSMGWCINCHRQTDVKFADNKYYDSYKTYHDELKAGTRQSVKVSDIGGLECQKCHY
ncbi:MAG: c-type cytochrome [Saprospiraceae bacterium]|nr:c-type cytochrome [Saprospiraceae bacterium]MBK7737078.1 c-type cytochrome [Saprospiraceae bacterium]MBK7914327.1 c-type cytochrome [Saprospiraceae bacterium]